MPVQFRIKKNYFQDALRLMRVSKSVGEMEGVNKAAAVMATDKAKYTIESARLMTPEIKNAEGGDLVMIVEAESEARARQIMDVMEEMVSAGSSKSGGESRSLLNQEIVAVNIGLDIFKDALQAQGVKVVQVSWEVPARGDEEIINILKKMY